MYDIFFLENPTRDQKNQLLNLYHNQGWWPRSRNNPETITQVLQGSHCFVAVEHRGEIIGMGRALSDATGDAYLHDILVQAAHRGNSLGKRIVTTLTRRLKEDGITWIGLIAEENSRGFYENLGFDIMKRATPMFIYDTEEPASQPPTINHQL